MSRRISFSRVLEFFRTGEADEVRAIMPLVLEAVGRRKILIEGPRPVQRRKRRLNGPDVISTSNSQVATATGDSE